MARVQFDLKLPLPVRERALNARQEIGQLAELAESVTRVVFLPVFHANGKKKGKEGKKKKERKKKGQPKIIAYLDARKCMRMLLLFMIIIMRIVTIKDCFCVDVVIFWGRGDEMGGGCELLDDICR